MKTICQRGLALLATLVLLFTGAVPAFAAGETYQGQYDVTYDQTAARTMPEMVNAFRTGEDASGVAQVDGSQVTALKAGTTTLTGTAQTTFTIVDCAHQWDAGVVTTEPFCDREGVMTYTCTVCHATRTEPIATKPHTPMTIRGVEPTCTVIGRSDAKICSTCGNTLEDAHVIPALGHAWDEGVETKAPTCTEAGEKRFTCSRCQETKTEPIAALGHAWDEGVETKAPTCTEAGEKKFTCSRCQETKTEPIAALGHAWDAGVETKAPTCTEAGEQMHSCNRCDATETQPIQATGHRYATVWSYDGATHWHACELCGDRKDEAAHSWKWVVDQDATETQPGSQHQECTVCGARGRTETILATAVADAEPDTTYRVRIHNQVPEDGTVTEAMVHEAMGKLPYDTGYDVVNVTTFFYDLVLQYKVGEGEWTDAEAANRSVTVTLPYPDGTNSADYDFIVTHYRDDKTMEQPAVTETEKGLQVTFRGLSPVAITAYQLREKAPEATPTPEATAAPSDEPTATIVPASSTAAPTATPTPAAAPAPTQTPAPMTAIPATGDDLPLALLVILCAAGAGGLAVLTVQARRRH